MDLERREETNRSLIEWTTLIQDYRAKGWSAEHIPSKPYEPPPPLSRTRSQSNKPLHTQLDDLDIRNHEESDQMGREYRDHYRRHGYLLAPPSIRTQTRERCVKEYNLAKRLNYKI